MHPPVPEGGPVWVSFLVYAAAALGALAAIAQGWRTARKGSTAPNAIVAGDIMATKPMADLAKAVDKLAENTGLQTAAMDRYAAASDRAAAASDRAAEAAHRSEDAMRDLCHALKDRQ